MSPLGRIATGATGVFINLVAYGNLPWQEAIWFSLGTVAIFLLGWAIDVAPLGVHAYGIATALAIVMSLGSLVGIILLNEDKPATVAEQVDSRKQAAIQQASAELGRQGFMLGKVWLEDSLTRGTVQVVPTGHKNWAYLAIEKHGATWVAGCPTVGGGMIPLSADNNRYAEFLQLSGSCPPGITGPAPTTTLVSKRAQ